MLNFAKPEMGKTPASREVGARRCFDTKIKSGGAGVCFWAMNAPG